MIPMQRPSDRPKPGITQNRKLILNKYVKLHDAYVAMQKAYMSGTRSYFEAALDELVRSASECPPSKTSKAELALWIALVLSIPVSMWLAITSLHPFWRTFDDQGGPGNCRTEMEGTHSQYPSEVDKRRHQNNGR